MKIYYLFLTFPRPIKPTHLIYTHQAFKETVELLIHIIGLSELYDTLDRPSD